MIALGSTEITKAYLGSTEIDKIYLGDELVFGGGSPASPYDAQVEYLESTGTQWIDTDIVDSWSGLIVTLDTLVYAESGEHDFFGSINPSRGYNYAGYFSNLSSNFVLQLGTPYVRYGVNDSLRHTHIFNAINKTCTYDNIVTTASNLSWVGSGNSTFKLLQRVLSNNSIQSPSHNILYSAKMEKDGVLVRDFIPVRKNGIGYLYDKVSGELFGNSGSGSFTYGNDIN